MCKLGPVLKLQQQVNLMPADAVENLTDDNLEAVRQADDLEEQLMAPGAS